MTLCNNCSTQITQNYCPNCGNSAQLKKIDSHYVSHEFLHLFHIEKGFLYTAKELLVRPGDSIREFIRENRSKHMKPIGFLILSSLIYTIIAAISSTSQSYNSKVKMDFGDSFIGKINLWVNSNYGYSNILMSMFIGLAIQLFFRKYKYNFFEIMVLLCYVMGQGMLLAAFESLFASLLSVIVFGQILMITFWGYATWSIGQFFDRTKVMSYVKAFFAYTLGFLLFQIAVILIGLSLDFIVKIVGH
jgi:hypothetical protein